MKPVDCKFCVGDEFTINTQEDIEALDVSTCARHRHALEEVLFDLMLVRMAGADHPAAQFEV